MKKAATLACLLVCLMPAWVKADEPEPAKQGWYSLKPSMEVEIRSDRLGPDADVNDEELVKIVGHGLETAAPQGIFFPGKLELATSKIKLWDEADKGITNSSSCFQRITFSSIGNR